MTKKIKLTLTVILSVFLSFALGVSIFFALSAKEQTPELTGEEGVATVGTYTAEAFVEETPLVEEAYTAFPSRVVLSTGNQYMLVIVGIDNVHLYDAIALDVKEHGETVEVDLGNKYYTGIIVKTGNKMDDGVTDETKTYTIADLFADAEKKPNGMIVHEIPYVEDLDYEITPSFTKTEEQGGAVLTAVTRNFAPRKLYTLTLHGATLADATGETQVDGSVAYQVAYGASLDMTPTVDNGQMFIAWQDEFGNYFGDFGNASYQDTMPRESLHATAVVGDFTTGFFTQPNIAGYTSSRTTVDGMDGYSVTIPAGAITDGYPENIHGSTFDTTSTGSKLMKATFKNNGAVDVTVEVYVTYYGAMVTTGHVTVPAGQTVTEYFTASTGINNPYWGFAVRSSAASTVTLDFGVGYAPLYPDGDIAYKTEGEAQYVTLGDKTYGGGWEASRPALLDNSLGLSSVATYDAGFKNNLGYISRKITNYSTDKTTIYAKITNNVNNRDYNATYRFVVSKNVDPTASGAVIAQKTLTAAKIGQTNVIKLDVPATTGDLYFCIIKNQNDKVAGDANYGLNLSVVLTYNDVLGYEEQWVHTALATGIANGEANYPASSGSPNWISGEFVTLDNGLTASKFTVAANTASGADVCLKPNDQDATADANGFNIRIPIYGKSIGKRTIQFTVTNHHATQSLSLTLYTPNYGMTADDSASVTVAAGGTQTFTLTTDNTSKEDGQNGDTTGPYIGMRLDGAVAEQMSFTMYGSFLLYENEISTIKVADDSAHKTTFKVGETFSSDKLNVAPFTHEGSSGFINIENFTTNYDGYVFKSRDVGTKTVTVSWGGTTATYEIEIVD